VNLRAIVKCCDDIENFAELYGSDESDLEDDLLLQYGYVFSLIRIGEYIKRLSFELREERPKIDWKGLAGLRDIIAHNYEGIDIPRVRSVIIDEIPPLKGECLSILGRI
jgi:uncharacterized protein with HEPN domain